MKTFNFPQLSPEWFEFRRGRVTASSMSRIITPKTGKYAAGAEGYLCELMGELATTESMVPDDYESRHMRAGTKMEPEARDYFCLQTGFELHQVGCCLSDCGRWSCSPDALIGTASGLECKAPMPKTQVAYLLNGKLPDDYKAQVHGCMIVTGRSEWWFLSYCRGLDPLLIKVVEDDYTAKLLAALGLFWKDYVATVAKMFPGREIVLAGCDSPIGTMMAKAETITAPGETLDEAVARMEREIETELRR